MVGLCGLVRGEGLVELVSCSGGGQWQQGLVGGVGFWRLLDAVVWIVDLEGWITWLVIGWDEGGL